MKLRKVDPRKIIVPEVRVTSRFDPETLAMLRASIRAEGLVAPIICCEIEDPKSGFTAHQPGVTIEVHASLPKLLVLVDGKNRLNEAIALNMPLVDVAVTEGDMVTVLTRNLFMDHVRGKHPVSEMVAVVEELWKTYKQGPDEIAKSSGMTREYVENLMLVSTLTPMVRAAVDDGSLKITAALQLTRLKSPQAQEEFFSYYRQYRWNTEQLREYITERLAVVAAPPVLNPAPPSMAPRTAECVYCNGQFTLDKLSNPTTCIGCFGDMVRSMAMARDDLEREAHQVEKMKLAEKEKPAPIPPADGGA